MNKKKLFLLYCRVTQHKAFIVGTCDKDLKRRIRNALLTRKNS